MRRNYYLYPICIVAMLLMAACHDDTDNMLADLRLSDTNIRIGTLGRYYTITVSDMRDEDTISIVSTTEDWIVVDGICRNTITLYVKPNETQRHRYGTVHIQSIRGRKASLLVDQLSEAEDGNNALDSGSLEVKSRVGWGYDLTKDYMDVSSATEQVFSYEGLLGYEKGYGIIVAQDRRNYLDYTIHTAYSIAEMAEHLMKEQTDGVSFFGLSKKVTKYKVVDNFEQSQNSYGFAKITKTVATRYIDFGKVEDIIHAGRTDIFTKEFTELYKAVLESPTQENAERLVTKFGTHVVTYADLGGRLEYTVNFNARQVSRDEMERVMKYKNGKLKEADEERRKNEFSTLSSTMTATAFGGSEATRLALQTATVSDDANQQIPGELLSAWANTVTYEQQDNLAMSNCRLTPIWHLFVDVEARNCVLSYIIRMVDNMVLSPEMREMLGLNGYYKFSVGELEPNNFNRTLVKVAYIYNMPTMEICNEYVPEIRGDGRVTIVYPITSQSTNIRRGFFLGDDENAPCEVSFDDKGGCYVTHIEGFQVGDIIDTLYYIDGALYADNMNIPVQNVMGKINLVNQFYNISSYGENWWYDDAYYPLVKIGPGYWSRINAIGCKTTIRDVPSHSVMVHHLSVEGINYIDASCLEKPYIATVDDLNALINYIGNNQKALFKDQQTGFDASFDGCCRVVAEYDGPELWYISYNLENKNKNCYSLFRNGKNGKCLELHSDYTFSVVDVQSFENGKSFNGHYFPYRLYYNNKRKYPKR